MITEVNVCSYEVLKAKGRPDLETNIFISIRDPDHENEVFPQSGERWLSIKFWDWSIDPEIPARPYLGYINLDGKPADEYFTEDKALDIVNFLNYFHKKYESYTLFVNCEQGISRSGAVASFAVDYCSLDYQEFKKHNNWISPNAFVSRILNKVLRNR